MDKREFLKSAAILGASAAGAAKMCGSAASASEPGDTAATPELLEPKFVSVDDHGFSSASIHLGEESGFSVTPIYQAKNVRGAYQRPPHNPTVDAFQAKIAAVEGAERAVSGPCGMSIISQTLLTFLSAGDRLVAHRCVYDNTMRLFREYFVRLGIEMELVDMNDPANLRAALAAGPTKVVYFEPYVNPTCEVLPAPALIAAAREAGAISIVDNTWLTPYLFQPLRHGADLVLHSATKYLGGHGSAMGGVVAGRGEAIGQIEATINVMGGILRPFDCFLLTQGVKTLAMRMKQHTASAQAVAEFLEEHPKVERVHYGGLPSWEGHAAGAEYLLGYGGMLGVVWRDDATHHNFPNRLRLAKPWVSLGDVVTLVYSRGAEPDRGIPARYARVSIGLEDTDDILADFEQALA